MTRLLYIVVAVATFCATGQAREFGNRNGNLSSGITMTNTTKPRALIGNAYTFTAGTNDTILYMGGYMASNGGNDSLKMAIYTVVSDAPDTRVTSVLEIGVVQDLGSGYVWDSVAVNFACVNGTEYCIAMGNVQGTTPFAVYLEASSGGSSGDGTTRSGLGVTLPATWGASTDNTGLPIVFATLNDAAVTGPPDVRHSSDGAGQRRRDDGNSVRRKP